MQGKLAEAIGDYDKAIQIYTRLVEEEGRHELADELARCLFGKALVYRRAGNKVKATGDLEKALLFVRDARLKQAIEDILRDNRAR